MTTYFFRLAGVVLIFARFFLSIATAGDFNAVHLRCDYAVNPLGVDSANPRLFWELESAERGQRRRRIKSSSRLLEKIWRATTAICGTAAKWLRTRRFKFLMPAKN